jgi:hypothetical protein
MSPYSGMVDLAEKKGLLKKEGNSLVYTTLDGEIIKQFRKKWEANEEGCLDTIIAEFGKQPVESTEPDIEDSIEE